MKRAPDHHLAAWALAPEKYAVARHAAGQVSKSRPLTWYLMLRLKSTPAVPVELGAALVTGQREYVWLRCLGELEEPPEPMVPVYRFWHAEPELEMVYTRNLNGYLELASWDPGDG